MVGPKFAIQALIMTFRATLPSTSRDDSADEFVNKVFLPDSLITYEYFENTSRKLPLEPEKHLMQAILEDAINIYRLHFGTKTGRHRKLFLDAQRWIWSTDDEWPFSFENICSALGLDPSFLRHGLQRWKERHEKQLAAQADKYPALRRSARL